MTSLHSSLKATLHYRKNWFRPIKKWFGPFCFLFTQPRIWLAHHKTGLKAPFSGILFALPIFGGVQTSFFLLSWSGRHVYTTLLTRKNRSGLGFLRFCGHLPQNQNNAGLEPFHKNMKPIAWQRYMVHNYF